MTTRIPVTLSSSVLDRLTDFCAVRQPAALLLVADSNTYLAFGRAVHDALLARNLDVKSAVLQGDVHPNEARILEVLTYAAGEARLYLAVGSGTITDITRYASLCSRNPFVSVPTAPSVDAYTSGGAALLLGGFKLTVPAQEAIAVFADLDVLRQAPPAMIAAGFSDILGKCIALADWKLGALLTGERFDAAVAAQADSTLQGCLARAAAIGQRQPEAIEFLMQALSESGQCMATFGTSRPASGSEHAIAHFWEMQQLYADRPVPLHGAMVGVGAIMMAGRYEQLRALKLSDVRRLLDGGPRTRGNGMGEFAARFGSVGQRVLAQYEPFGSKLDAEHAAIGERILSYWPQIMDIAAAVPAPERLRGLLIQAGAATQVSQIGLQDADATAALSFARYMRGRVTVDTLGRILQLW